MQCKSEKLLAQQQKNNTCQLPWGKFLTSKTDIRQTQINRALVISAPFSPIKLIHNIMDNAIQNRQWISIFKQGWPDELNFIIKKTLGRSHKARWTRVLIKLILRCWGQDESQLVYRPEKVSFLYTEVRMGRKGKPSLWILGKP